MESVELVSGDAGVLVVSLLCSLEMESSELQFLSHLFHSESEAEEGVNEILVSLSGWLTELFDWRQRSTYLDTCTGKPALQGRVVRLVVLSRYDMVILLGVHQELDGRDIWPLWSNMELEVDTGTSGLERLP